MFFEWTDAAIATMADMAARGASFAQVAEHLGGGLTRSAIGGKARRLGIVFARKPGGKSPTISDKPLTPAEAGQLAPRGKTEVKNRPQRAAPLATADEVAAPAPPAPTKPDPFASKFEGDKALKPVRNLPTGPVTLVDLCEHHCRWPLGDPSSPSFRYCGSLRIPGSRYCVEHKTQARGAGTQSERSATRVLRHSIK